MKTFKDFLCEVKFPENNIIKIFNFLLKKFEGKKLKIPSSGEFPKKFGVFKGNKLKEIKKLLESNGYNIEYSKSNIFEARKPFDRRWDTRIGGGTSVFIRVVYISDEKQTKIMMVASALPRQLAPDE